MKATECKCQMSNGAHDPYCPTRNEADMYTCIGCGQPTWFCEMAEGKCPSCRGEPVFGESAVSRLFPHVVAIAKEKEKSDNDLLARIQKLPNCPIPLTHIIYREMDDEGVITTCRVAPLTTPEANV